MRVYSSSAVIEGKRLEGYLTACVCAKSLHSRLTLCGPPGPSVRGTLQARILEWAAVPFSRGSSLPRDQTHLISPAMAVRFFTTSATWEANLTIYMGLKATLALLMSSKELLLFCSFHSYCYFVRTLILTRCFKEKKLKIGV